MLVKTLTYAEPKLNILSREIYSRDNYTAYCGDHRRLHIRAEQIYAKLLRRLDGMGVQRIARTVSVYGADDDCVEIKTEN